MLLSTLILLDSEDTLVLGQRTKERSIKRVSVLALEGPRVAFPQYIEHLLLVYSARATAQDALALAKWCEEQGMTRDVQLHYWRALDLDAHSEEAHLALGHRKGSAGWTISNGKSAWMSLAALEERKVEKDEPWLLTTAHFDLEATGSLHQVLRTAATLEVIYFHFYELLQELGEDIRGYFDEPSGVLRSWYEEGEVVNLVRLMTHALQYRAVEERTKSTPEQYPDWLWEGLGIYFDACYRPTDGVPDYLPGHLHGGWLHLHAQASSKDRHDLDTLLNFEHGGIGAHPDAQLLFAEAYTLCLFLLQGEDLSTLDSLKQYLHHVFRGQGAANKFRKSFSKRQRKDLENDWWEFVVKEDLRLQQ